MEETMPSHDKHDKDKPQRKTSVSLYGINHTFNSPHEAAAFINFLHGGNNYHPKAVEEVMSTADEDEEKQKTIEQEKKDSEAQAEKARMDALDPHEREALEKNGGKGKKGGVHAHDANDKVAPPAQGPNVGAVKGQTPMAANAEREKSKHATAARKFHVKRQAPKRGRPAKKK
jgi:hypothetical protein